ncbi:F-box protein: endocytic membrane traffic, recycling ReCYcling 1 [Sorochytrium milnesiophthora]
MSRRSDQQRLTTALSPDILVRVFSFLSVSDLAHLATCSRRLKLLAYHEAIYEAKLCTMRFPFVAGGSSSKPSASGQISLIKGTLPVVPDHLQAVWRSVFPELCAAPATGGDNAPDNERHSSPSRSSSSAARDTFRSIYQRLKSHYAEFEPGKSHRSILTLDSRQETATYLAMLTLLGKTMPHANSGKINVELHTASELFESKVLSMFDKALQLNDTNELKNLAQTLYYLNGGEACAQMFIYKCPIFFDQQSDVTEHFRVLSVDGGQDSPLQAYLDEMFDTIEAQMPQIRTVFPNPQSVIYLFIQKAFDDLIIDYLTRLLQEAESRDLSVFLQSLTQIFEHTSYRIQRLSDQLDSKPVEKMFQQCLQPFTDQYMEYEMAHINREYAAMLGKWNKKAHYLHFFLSEARKAPVVQPVNKMKQLSALNDEIRRKVLTSVKTVLMTPTAMMQKALKQSPGKAYKMTEGGWGLDNMATLGKPEVISSVIPEKLGNLDMLLSVELALAMIHINKDSLKRCIVMMSTRGSAKPYVEKVFACLVKQLGLEHVKPSFDLATERLAMFHPSFETAEATPLNQFFEMVQVADLILQMVHLYFTEEIQKFVSASEFLSEANQEKKKFEHVIDDCIAAGLDQAIRVLMDQVEYVIATEQSPTDYCPSAYEELEVKPTKACTKAIDCMTKHAQMLTGFAEKQVLEVFLSEIGVRFFALLCKHIKRLTISEQGGWRLISDLNAYHAWSQTLRNSEVVRHFKALKELANIYIVSDQAGLRELVKDPHRYAGIFRVEEVYEFIERRQDYDKIKSKVRENECVVM